VGARKISFDPPEKKKPFSELVNPIVIDFGKIALENVSVSEHGAMQWIRGQGIMIDPQSVKKPFRIVRLLCPDDMRLHTIRVLCHGLEHDVGIGVCR
jgi:hypothetical protein